MVAPMDREWETGLVASKPVRELKAEALALSLEDAPEPVSEVKQVVS